MFNFFNNKSKSITPKEAKAVMETEKDIFLIDVRSTEEYKDGHIPNSISMPLHILDTVVRDRVKDKDAKIIVYCLSGGRSSKAASILSDMGYVNVYNLGGISSWPYGITK